MRRGRRSSPEPRWIFRRELDAVEAREHVDSGILFRALTPYKVMRLAADHDRSTGSVTLERTGAHTPGHQVVRIDSAGERAALLGHLALSPVHLATGVCPQRAHGRCGRAVDARVAAGRWVDGRVVAAA
jgi:glyoxylase-like metal-dependent hydrolase (beta-lactamase superfamily II)